MLEVVHITVYNGKHNKKISFMSNNILELLASIALCLLFYLLFLLFYLVQTSPCLLEIVIFRLKLLGIPLPDQTVKGNQSLQVTLQTQESFL